MTAAELGPAATPDRLEALARQRARYLAARRAVLAFLVLVGLGVVVALTYVTVETRATAAQVAACTTPGQPCYEALRSQSAASRAALVAEIQDALDDSTAPSRANRETLLSIQHRLEQTGCLPVPNR